MSPALILRFVLPSVLFFVFCGTNGGFCAEQASPQKDAGEYENLAEGVYARIARPDDDSVVSNSGFVILDRSVLVFDTHYTPEAGLALLTKIRSITPKPVRFVVNSHYHADHTHGNQAFPGSSQIIGTVAARRDALQKDSAALKRALNASQEQIKKLQKDLSEATDAAARARTAAQIRTRRELIEGISSMKVLPPVIAVEDKLIVRDGKREVELFSLGGGHTDGDLILYLPSEKIIFAGDIFFNAALPNTQDACILDWMKTLSALAQLGATKFIPGHGSIGAKSDVLAFLAYFDELKRMVEPAVMRGDTVDQVIRDTRVPDKYSSYRFQQFFSANVQQMYTELKAQMPETAPSVISPEDAKNGGVERQ
jgi:cyclase